MIVLFSEPGALEIPRKSSGVLSQPFNRLATLNTFETTTHLLQSTRPETSQKHQQESSSHFPRVVLEVLVQLRSKYLECPCKISSKEYYLTKKWHLRSPHLFDSHLLIALQKKIIETLPMSKSSKFPIKSYTGHDYHIEILPFH